MRYVWRIKSDSETSLDSETRIQKLFGRIQKLCRWIQKLLRRIQKRFRRIQKLCVPKLFRWIQKLCSQDSETFFVGFRNFFPRIQKLCSSDSETVFVGFSNFFRRIQKLFSSDSETLFDPCLQWLLHSFYQNFPPTLSSPTHAFNDYYIPFIKISPPWQPMLSMIQVQVLHSFYQDFYIPLIKIWPPPLATFAFNDSGSSTTFLLSRFLHSFYQHFLLPPPGNPTHAFNDYCTTFLSSKFRSPPWQPNPCYQWLLHSFYQNFPPLGNPCFEWFRFKYYIPFILIFTVFLSKFPPPGNPTHAFNDYYIHCIKNFLPRLANQPMLSMITTFLLSKFHPPLGNPCFQWFRFKYYIPFNKIFTFLLSKFAPPPPPPGQPNQCFQWLLNSFYTNLTPPPLATHAFNDSGSSITFLLSTFLHSFYQHFPPPWQPNPCFQWLLHSF